MNRLEIVVLLAAFIFMAFTVEILRRRRLSESYALLWLSVGIGTLILGLARPVVDKVSAALGIAYGTSLIFGVGLLFLLGVCINLSIHVSKLEARVEVLAEEITLLRGPVETDRTRTGQGDAGVNEIDSSVDSLTDSSKDVGHDPDAMA